MVRICEFLSQKHNDINEKKLFFGEGNQLPDPCKILYEQELVKKSNLIVFVGFENLGNTCFMNSVLQCLLNVSSWMHYLLVCHTKSCNINYIDCIICTLAKLVLDMHMKSKTMCEKQLPKILKKTSSNFVLGEQQDAHEFYICLLDKIQENLMLGHKSTDPYIEMTTAAGQIFGGILRSQLCCQECSKTSNSYEQFFNLSLDIMEVSVLKEALDKFVAPQKLNDEYNCDRCNRNTRAGKRYSIHKLPDVLVVHLKRYDHRGKKLTHYVSFAQSLDVDQYMSIPHVYDTQYVLSGVIVHRGRYLTTGHYLSYVRDPNPVHGDLWYCLNDSSVTRVTTTEVLYQDAYMLFYQKG